MFARFEGCQLQANFLRDLNRRGDAESVIRHFESGRISSSEASLGEYIKALAKVDKLDNTALLRTLQVRCRAELSSASSISQPILLRLLYPVSFSPYFCYDLCWSIELEAGNSVGQDKVELHYKHCLLQAGMPYHIAIFIAAA